MREVIVYLPVDESAPWAHGIARGSALVNAADGAPDGRIPIDYEGAIYGQVNLARFADRVHTAAGRGLSNYPTGARIWVHPAELYRLGTFDPETGDVTLDDPGYEPLLADWLDLADGIVPASELQATDYQFELRRQLASERASGDPARIFAAERAARRLGIERA